MGISKVISLVDEFTSAEEAQRNAYQLTIKKVMTEYHSLV